MNRVFLVAVVAAVFACGFAQQTRPPPDPCRTCEIIINIARFHFNNTVNDKAALLTQLQYECGRLAQFEGADAAAQCNATVTNNIDVIYNDMHTQKTSLQTCQDIGQCPMMTTTTMPKRQKRQDHSPCRVCEIIIGIAKRHFHNNITDQNALKAQLDMECQNLVNHGFTAQEAQNCQTLVDSNIAAIFNELVQNPSANPRKVCQDLGQCPTGAPMVARVKRQNPMQECQMCELIMRLARHYFNNSITNENALKTQLNAECDNLSTQHFGPNATGYCHAMVNDHIDQIFKDVSQHDHDRQTCRDINICPHHTTTPPPQPRQKRQQHNPCRTCEIIVNIARHHFHNNVTNKDALKAQLLVECQHLTQTEGQQAADHCKQIVNNNINQIYADMSTHKTARQTCQDIHECPAQMSQRVKRQRPPNNCRTCEIIVNLARHHFHNNITDKNALKAQLLMECQNLSNTEGAQAAAHCTMIVNNNIDQIYNDMHTNKNAHQTCLDIKECP